MKDLSSKIIEKIKKEQVEPIPKWRFTLIRVLFLITLIIALFTGALAISFLIRIFFGIPWELVPKFQRTLISSILSTLPYVWISSIAIAYLLAHWGFKNIKNLYRYSPKVIILFITLLTLPLGTLFFFLKLDLSLEPLFVKHLPYYLELEKLSAKKWANPEIGLLAGEIEGVDLDLKQIIVEDLRDIEWKVDLSQIKKPLRMIKEGHIILMEGEKISESEFRAKKIIPWKRALERPWLHPKKILKNKK